MLRGRQTVHVARLRDFKPGAKPRRARGANRVGVEPDPRAHLTRPPSPVAQVRRDRLIRVTRHDPDRGLNFATFEAEFHHLPVLHPKALRGGQAEHGRVIPGELGQGLRQFLEPAIVSKLPVPNCGVWSEDDFKAAALTVAGGRVLREPCAEIGHELHWLGRQSRPGNHSLVEPGFPGRFKIRDQASGVSSSPGERRGLAGLPGPGAPKAARAGTCPRKAGQ